MIENKNGGSATRVFNLCDGRYGNLCELARAMGISLSQIYRVRQGNRRINEKFVIGAIKAFPNRRLDELFYWNLRHCLEIQRDRISAVATNT